MFISLEGSNLYNIHIHSGVHGSSTTNMKTITITNSSEDYETNVVAPGSNTIEV